MTSRFLSRAGSGPGRSRAWFFRLPAAIVPWAMGVLMMTAALIANAADADKELFQSIAYRDPARFQAALDAGANARAVNAGGGTVLHDAVIFWGDTAVITKLLAKGADINAANAEGETPLLRSLQHVHYSSDAARVDQVVQLLLSRGAGVNLADKKGFTPLAAALELGRMPLVDAVIRAGGRFPPDSLFKTLALGTNVPLIQLLMSRPKDLDLSLRDGSGRTLAHLAAQSDKTLFLLRWLVERGADLQARDHQQRSLLAEAALFDSIPAMDYLFGKGLKLDAVDRDGAQVAHMGARGGRYSVMKWLVDHGADLQARDKWGRRPLDIAIESHRFAFAKETDRLALATLLGGDASDVARGAVYQHPLHVAVWAGNLREVERLLEAGANVNVKDESGLTALGRAIDLASGGPATAEQISYGRKLLPLLLKYGADTTLRLPGSLETYDDYARRSRSGSGSFGPEMERLKARHGR